MARSSRGRRGPICSFCGKDAQQAQHIIAGPNVFICNECVALCNEILASAPTTSPNVPQDTAVEASSRLTLPLWRRVVARRWIHRIST
jgi:ATP-dependent protease Clp ATPase subunit